MHGDMADPKKPRAPFAPWDRRELPGAFTVEESARRVGNYKWVEMRLFEALGGWVATVPELDVKMRLGTHCYHHAWHAELWHKRLPELREMNPERLTVPRQRRARRLHRRHDRARGARADDREAGRRLPGADPAQDRGVHVPPEQHVARSPTRRRSARSSFILQDEFEDWRDGEMLIQSLIETDEEVERAAAHQARAREAHARGRRHRRPRFDRYASRAQPRGGRRMKKTLPVEELARDERFVRGRR